MFKSKRNKIIIGAAVVLLLVVAVVLRKQFGSTGTEVYAEEISKGNITEIVSSNGKIQPEVEVSISPEVAGEVIEVMVNEGDKVKEGDVLIKINPDLLESARDRINAALNSSRANLANAKARQAQAKARLINAEATFKRNKSLWDQKAISEAEYDAALSAFEVAKADLEAAKQSVSAAEFNVQSSRAALKEADNNLLRTVIRAPMDGTVSMRDVEPGERVVGTAQMAGTEVMRIADLTAMEVNVEVNENDIVRVGIGDTADIEVDAFLDRIFKGVVTEIANSSNNANAAAAMGTDQVTTFDVKIRILRSSYDDLIDTSRTHLSPFRPGMSAVVNINTDRVFDVMRVPIQSVTLREDTSVADGLDKLKECVFLIDGKKARLVFVESGIQDKEFIEIKSGLSMEDKVVTGPYSAISTRLKDGKSIEVTDKDDFFSAADKD